MWYGEFFGWLKKPTTGAHGHPTEHSAAPETPSAGLGATIGPTFRRGSPCSSTFFYTLRAAKLPVSVKEYLTLLEALQAGVIGPSVDDFYYLRAPRWSRTRPTSTSSTAPSPPTSRAWRLLTDFTQDVPLEWLRKTLELELSPRRRPPSRRWAGTS
jgi:hypothetical protein